MRKNKFFEKGQILLIIALLSTVLLTSVFSISQISTKETKIAKLEEDSKKAFAAAEAGIEKAIRDLPLGGSFSFSLEEGKINVNATTQAVRKSTFVSPLVKKDQQYTFYMADYNPQNNTFSNYFTGNLEIYFQGENCSSTTNPPPTLELTIISSTNTIQRKIIDPCQKVTTSPDLSVSSGDYTLENQPFNYKTTTSLSISNTKLLIIRSLFNQTKIGLAANTNLPPQGKTIISTGQTSTGVKKTIEFFQSFPQIPAEFFVTSF